MKIAFIKHFLVRISWISTEFCIFHGNFFQNWFPGSAHILRVGFPIAIVFYIVTYLVQYDFFFESKNTFLCSARPWGILVRSLGQYVN